MAKTVGPVKGYCRIRRCRERLRQQELLPLCPSCRIAGSYGALLCVILGALLKALGIL